MSFFRKPPRKKIAILIPNSNDLLRTILSGLQGELATVDIPHELWTLSAEEDYGKLNQTLGGLIEKVNLDLIYSIGTNCTRVAKAKTEEKGVLTPIVFGAVHDPKGSGLVEGDVFSGNHLTGVKAGDWDFEMMFNGIRDLFPRAKNVLVICDRSCETRRGSVNDSISYLKMQDYSVRVVDAIDGIISLEDLLPFSLWAELGVIVREARLQKYSGIIAQFSQDYSIPIYASDLESVRRGVPFGFGMPESSTGIQTARHGIDILEGKVLPHKYPINQLVESYRLSVNREALKQLLEGKGASHLKSRDVFYI